MRYEYRVMGDNGNGSAMAWDDRPYTTLTKANQLCRELRAETAREHAADVKRLGADDAGAMEVFWVERRQLGEWERVD